MEIAVIGSPEFTLGFQLAGITHLHNPADEEELASLCRSMIADKDVGIVIRLGCHHDFRSSNSAHKKTAGNVLSGLAYVAHNLSWPL